MKVIFFLNHPAHYHLFRNVIKKLKDKHEIQVLMKKKDILETLLSNDGITYTNILPKGRGDKKFLIALSLIKKDWALLRMATKFQPDVMIGTSAEIAHVGKLTNTPSIVVNEDDSDVVPLFSRLAYPFARHIITPRCCKNGQWSQKAVYYDGYHELAYLGPGYFCPSADVQRVLAPDGKMYFISVSQN